LITHKSRIQRGICPPSIYICVNAKAASLVATPSPFKKSQRFPAKIIAQAIEAFANFGYSIRLTFAHRSNYVVNNLVWLIKFASC
jgi:hypothetical protein